MPWCDGLGPRAPGSPASSRVWASLPLGRNSPPLVAAPGIEEQEAMKVTVEKTTLEAVMREAFSETAGGEVKAG